MATFFTHQVTLLQATVMKTFSPCLLRFFLFLGVGKIYLTQGRIQDGGGGGQSPLKLEDLIL